MWSRTAEAPAGPTQPEPKGLGPVAVAASSSTAAVAVAGTAAADPTEPVVGALLLMVVASW